MITGDFETVDINSITVNRTERQRKELPEIPELADSIHRLGLIHPIIIDENNLLVAGERRWTACRSLGWTSIPVQRASDLSEYEFQCIEFEENVKRVNLTWQEEVAAMEKFHELKTANEKDWTAEATSEALGMSLTKVQRSLRVAKELDNEKVAAAPKFAAAHNLVQRSLDRRKAAAIDAVDAGFATAIPTADEPIDLKPSQVVQNNEVAPILNESFHDWQKTYTGPKFNVLHCDFPYGINVANAPRQNAALTDHYDDSPDIYWDLLARLADAMDNVVSETAHMIFWFSMDYYSQTVQQLTAMGWKVNPFPLIWHKSDNSGIAPDPQRLPRRIYEAALFCTRGDAKLTEAGPKANVCAFPGRKDGAIHISEKPEVMLQHFLSMVVDENSSVLDPTCGSGNALIAADCLEARRVLGLEIDPKFHELACLNWFK